MQLVRQTTAILARRPWLLIAAIVVLGVGLRWYHLSEWDMWNDEVDTLWIAETGEYTEGPMYRTAPVNFWLTAASARVFGSNELGERFPSFLAGVLTLVLFFATFRSGLGDRAAILGTLFLCLSMWHVYWSQVGRHFSPQVLFILLGIYFLVKYWKSESLPLAWFAAASTGVALATHSSTVFFLVAFVAVLGSGFLASLAGRADGTPRKYLMAGIPFLLLLLAYLPVLSAVGDYVMQNKVAWNPPYGIVASYLFYLNPVFLFVALGGFLIMIQRGNELGWLLAGLILVPLGLILYSTTRTLSSVAYILASVLPVAALVGVAADWLLESGSERGYRWAATAIVVGVFVAQSWELAHYYMVYNGLKPRWKEAMAYVDERRGDGDSVYAAEGQVGEYYLGSGEAGWLGMDEVSAAPEPGAWYIDFMSLGPMPDDMNPRVRLLQEKTRVMAIFPLHYGAKNRTLVVLHATADPEPPVSFPGAVQSPP
jgi:hypothetical protein